MPTLTLFFRQLIDSACGQSLLFLRQHQKIFEVYLACYRYYLVIPFTEVAHPSICEIHFGTPSECSDKFLKFWRQNHFLVKVGTYVYLADDLSQEETYLKRKLVAFWKNLGFVDDIVPPKTSLRK